MKPIDIAKANARFDRLTKAQKRVEIAKDAIKQILTHTYQPVRGSYFYVAGDNMSLQLNQPTLLESTVPCRVCARGALWLSIIRKDNKFDMPWASLEYNHGEQLEQRFFSATQTELMEQAFEGKGSFRSKSKLFYHKYHGSDKRLLAILRNIIRNKGTFRP